MSRKLSSVVAVLAFLSLSLAGAAQARPLAACPTGPFLQALCHWVASGGAKVWEKEGPGMDPNGHKHLPFAPELSPTETRTRLDRAATRRD